MSWKTLGLFTLILLPVLFGIQVIVESTPIIFGYSQYTIFPFTLPGMMITWIILPATLSGVIFRFLRSRIEMNMKTFLTGVVYLLVGGKLAVTLGFGYLSWLVEYSRDTLSGPGFGFFIAGDTLLWVLTFFLSLILLRFSTQKYRIVIFLLIFVLLLQVGFYFLDSSINYSRGW